MKKHLNSKWIAVSDSVRPGKISGMEKWSGGQKYDSFRLPNDDRGLSYFAREFSVERLSRAFVSASSLGVFELYVNGIRVGCDIEGETVYDELKPGWTDYRKRVAYYTYDLTPYVKEGKNLFVAAVAPGWYNGRISTQTYGANNHVAFISEITIDDANGMRTIGTDGEWIAGFGGAVRTADIWDGEIYDASFASPEEINPGVSELNWSSAAEEEHEIEITPAIGPSIRIRKGIAPRPVSVNYIDRIEDNGTDFGKGHIYRSEITKEISVKEGERVVVDFGQNHVGFPTFTVSGAEGTQLYVRFGEMLNDSGMLSRGNDGPENTVYSENYRSAAAKIIVRPNGKTVEMRPVMTFFGYRYVEFTSEGDVRISELETNVVGSDIEETGHIETSHPMLNQLLSNVIWGQRSNYVSIPTDCPQRDERFGWTGDTQAFCSTAAYNANVLEFFRKWLQDARDSQHEDGQYTDVIPEVRIVGSGATAWSDAGIIVPYTIWKLYGDITILADHYSSMKKYMDWLDSNGFRGPLDRYGDWLAYEPTDQPFISAAFYALDTRYMQEMALALGNISDAAKYEKRLAEIIGNFRMTFCGEDGNILEKYRTQTGYLIALKFGLLSENARREAAAALADKIKANGCVLSTGFIGTYLLCDTLAENGYNNLAYSLLLQTECPSWFYSILQGATTIWERWNSYTIEKGFGDVGMNSFNHYAYGSVVEWIYSNVCGIQNAEGCVGFEKIRLCPKPDLRTDAEIPAGQERVRYAHCTFNSASGKIVSDWDNYGEGICYHFVSPVSATIELPAVKEHSTITVNEMERSLTDTEKRSGVICFPAERGEYFVVTQ